MKKINMYIRLVNYENAIIIIDKAKMLGGDGNITVGGFWIKANKDIWFKLINFIESMKISYELNPEHPTKITNSIIKQFKE